MSDPATPHWEFHLVPDPVAGLEAAYQGIHFDLMAVANPRLNERIEVEGADPETADGWHRLLLVTPWTGLRVYLPVDPGDPAGLPEAADLACEADGRVTTGSEVRLAFGGGEVALEVAYDPRLGHHLVEGLLTDMGAFSDTGEAVEWAREVARRRDRRPRRASDRTPPRSGRLSRRDLLRGRLGGR